MGFNKLDPGAHSLHLSAILVSREQEVYFQITFPVFFENNNVLNWVLFHPGKQ
jgi:hypothetical protein